MVTRNFSALCCEQNNRLELAIAKTQQEKLLGLNTIKQGAASPEFAPCAISLTPWKLSRAQFELALATARSFSQVLRGLSENTDLLLSMLSDYQDTDSLLYKLRELLASRREGEVYLSENLNLSRYDFLLDRQNHWQLVESNAIAAGMGPFSEKLGELTEEYPSENNQRLAKNPSIERQAGAMYKAASLKGNTFSPTIVFVVAPNEDNVFDQNYLIQALENLGAKVVRQTFDALSTALNSKDDRLILNGIGEIDLFYFRTGYNLHDYSKDNPDYFIQLRDKIEKHRVVVSPAIAHQISSSKWVQMKLAQMPGNALSELLSLTLTDTFQIKRSLSAKYELIENIWQVKRALQAGGWLLKNQNEGGGNVTDDNSILPEIGELHQSYFLMEKIESQIRSDVCRFKDGIIDCLPEVISELGVFMVGEEHEYGGYLLRSKPSGQVEGGVHGGHGFLDVVSFDKEPRASILKCC